MQCPLCMEALDWDDLGFFPCSCGYQICRFCWHRLRTDENGLCPACRQAFPDIPVSFNPEISAEELKKQQKRRNREKRSNKDQVFKPQDLATLRVVQKNLVFVIGLSSRLTQEDLKKEFAHFGKIIKFVHNKSTAYITYSKPEEAIRAIRTLNASAAQESAAQQFQIQSQLLNGAASLATNPSALINIASSNNNNNNSTAAINSLGSLNNTNSFVNAMPTPAPVNRLKASLGTTKYCNHFLRSQQCPKVGECMYLHEIAEAEASFTKEQMQAGKHVEYEKKLMDAYSAKLEWQAGMATQNSNGLVRAPQITLPLQQQQQTSNSRQPQQQLLAPQSQQPQLQLQQQQQQQQQPQHQHQLQQQQQQLHEQQQQHQLEQSVPDTDSEDDGLDFDPISVSTSGLRDLLDQQVQQAKQIQMQNYFQQMNYNQSLANVLFQQNNRLNHPTQTNGLLEADHFTNGHPQTLSSLAAGLSDSANQQSQVTWRNLNDWTNFLQRSGYGFENSR